MHANIATTLEQRYYFTTSLLSVHHSVLYYLNEMVRSHFISQPAAHSACIRSFTPPPPSCRWQEGQPRLPAQPMQELPFLLVLHTDYVSS